MRTKKLTIEKDVPFARNIWRRLARQMKIGDSVLVSVLDSFKVTHYLNKEGFSARKAREKKKMRVWKYAELSSKNSTGGLE